MEQHYIHFKGCKGGRSIDDSYWVGEDHIVKNWCWGIIIGSKNGEWIAKQKCQNCPKYIKSKEHHRWEIGIRE